MVQDCYKSYWVGIKGAKVFFRLNYTQSDNVRGFSYLSRMPKESFFQTTGFWVCLIKEDKIQHTQSQM